MSQEKIGSPTIRDRFRGIFLGTAVGDSIGLPVEGLSPQRAGKLFIMASITRWTSKSELPPKWTLATPIIKPMVDPINAAMVPA